MTSELRTGRWQDVLVGTYDPARAIVITDPPYGLSTVANASGGAAGIHTRVKLDRRRPFDPYKGFPDDVPWSRHVEEVLDLLPARRHLIRGPATALVKRDYPEARRICIEFAPYRRTIARLGVVPYLWQGWAVYGRLRIERHRTPPTGDAVITSAFARDQRSYRPRSDHRALTPYTAASWIIANWADDDCIVLDPFAGLATIGLAAVTLGFDYLGAELLPVYADAGRAALLVERPTLGLEEAAL